MKLTVSPSPHIHGQLTASQCMYGVIIALLPAWLVSLYYFGIGALVVSFTAILSCVAVEYLIQRYMLKEKNSIPNGSAILTGLLLALNLPSNLPIWIVIIGSIAAIGITKMAFGGLGNNLFNPALAGRVFLLISFPTYMTSWPLPGVSRGSYTDAETGATLLSRLKEGGGELLDAQSGATQQAAQSSGEWINQIDMTDLWLGNQGGSLGEVGAIALLIGFAYLLYRRIITWHIPVSILATVFLFSFALGLGRDYSTIFAFDYALIQLLSGGLLLGAIFMATDYVTSPMTHKGMIIYGIAIGLLTVIIRQWGGYPEGVSFAILIMNAFTPLINNYVKPKRFGRN